MSFNKVVVTRYRIYPEDRRLAPGTRRLAYEAADARLLGPELAASIRRVKGVRKMGVRLGNWLTASTWRVRQNWALGGGHRVTAFVRYMRPCQLFVQVGYFRVDRPDWEF